MNEESILESITAILSEKRSKFDNGIENKALNEYCGCIAALESIASTGELKSPYFIGILDRAIAQFKQHLDLCVIVGGRISPLYPPIAARFSIKNGSLVSSNKFVAIRTDTAVAILADAGNDILWPDRSIWDPATSSLLSINYFNLRYNHVS